MKDITQKQSVVIELDGDSFRVSVDDDGSLQVEIGLDGQPIGSNGTTRGLSRRGAARFIGRVIGGKKRDVEKQ